tara:strand:- start:326 stop:475 length:150 start_codon:yes stop_codon:yes gene_type:complete
MVRKTMTQCPMCGESGSMVEKTVYPSMPWIEYYCNVCGHSWKIIKEDKK